MTRFNQLIITLRAKFPNDWWIEQCDIEKCLNLSSFPQEPIYENALSRLDEDSWQILYEKAVQAFDHPQTDRGKDQFFNILNEALAYQYLIDAGFSEVALLKESKRQKTPDISYLSNQQLHCCEVKTISISDDEIKRFKLEQVFDLSIYQKLSDEFIAKFKSTIEQAKTQLNAYEKPGMIYLIIHFDDFVLKYFETYRHQIIDVLSSEFPFRKIVVRVGIHNEHYILHDQ